MRSESEIKERCRRIEKRIKASQWNSADNPDYYALQHLKWVLEKPNSRCENCIQCSITTTNNIPYCIKKQSYVDLYYICDDYTREEYL